VEERRERVHVVPLEGGDVAVDEDGVGLGERRARLAEVAGPEGSLRTRRARIR
jgi:RecA/RadA recombinase